MMDCRHKKLILFGLGIFFVFLLPHIILAVESFPSIKKAKIRLSVKPGEIKYGDLLIDNPSSEPRTMHAYLEDWKYTDKGDGVKDFLPANTLPFSCSSWITFSPAVITIPPYATQRVGYSVKAPADAQGTYYSVLFFETGLGEEKIGAEGFGAGISLAVRIGALFYVEVEGTVKRNAEFQNLRLNKENSRAPLLIELEFKNTGTADITAGGSYYIMDSEGIIYARGEFNDVYTFPNDTAKLTATWKDPIPKGKYSLVITVDANKAQQEPGSGPIGPATVKESEIEIGANGEVVKIGDLK